MKYFTLLFLTICLFLTHPNNIDAKIPLVIASSGEEGDNFAHHTFVKFMDLIEEKAPGVFDIQYKPSMQLGDEADTVRLVQSGSIQMATLLSNTMANFAPIISWMNMPYLFESREDFHDIIWQMWDFTNEKVITQSGCRLLLINEIGFRAISTKNTPIKNLDQARKLKIRLPGSKLDMALYKNLGLTAVPINFAETFAALSQGVVDGQESAYALITLKKFYEVQKYVLDTKATLHIGVLIVSEKWFSSLPKEAQQALVDAGKEASIYEFTEIAPTYIKKSQEIMRDNGMIFLGLPDDLDEWVKLGRQSWPMLYPIIGSGDQLEGEKIINRIKNVKKDTNNISIN